MSAGSEWTPRNGRESVFWSVCGCVWVGEDGFSVDYPARARQVWREERELSQTVEMVLLSRRRV